MHMLENACISRTSEAGFKVIEQLQQLRFSLFQVEQQPFDLADVLLAGRLFGWQRRLVARVRQHWAACAHWRTLGLEWDDDVTDLAAHEFRQRRGLVRAADAQAWLEARFVSVDDWYRYLRREALRQRWRKQMRPLVARYPLPASKLGPAEWLAGLCSDRFTQWAHRLAGIAATAAALPADLASTDPVRRVVRLRGLEADEVAQRTERLQTLWQRREQVLNGWLEPSTVRSFVDSTPGDWITVEYESAFFANLDVAREAMLLVSEDDKELDEATQAASGRYKRRRNWLGEIMSELRGILHGARPGDWIGPRTIEGEVILMRVISKSPPNWQDPELRDRVRKLIVPARVAAEVGRRVRWLHPWRLPYFKS